jgi:hypothetical protein
MARVSESSNPTNQKLNFITSNNGQPLLVMNDYVYKCNKKTTKKKYWTCAASGCNTFVKWFIDIFFYLSFICSFSNNKRLIQIKRLIFLYTQNKKICSSFFWHFSFRHFSLSTFLSFDVFTFRPFSLSIFLFRYLYHFICRHFGFRHFYFRPKLRLLLTLR